MQADEVGGPVDALGERGDRQRRGVRAQQRVRRDDLARPRRRPRFFSAADSKTASITRSQPARSAESAVGRDPREQGRALLGRGRPRCTPLATRPSEYALPFAAASGVTSLSTTVPADPRARRRRCPRPSSRRRARRPSSAPTARTRPGATRRCRSSACRRRTPWSCSWPPGRRPARRSSGSRCAARCRRRPARPRRPRRGCCAAPGIGAPLSCLRRFAGNAGSTAASFGRRGRAAGDPVARGVPGLARPPGSLVDPGPGAGASASSRLATSSSTIPISSAAAGRCRCPWPSTFMNPSAMPSMRVIRVTPPAPGSSPSVTSGSP